MDVWQQKNFENGTLNFILRFHLKLLIFLNCPHFQDCDVVQKFQLDLQHFDFQLNFGKRKAVRYLRIPQLHLNHSKKDERKRANERIMSLSRFENTFNELTLCCLLFETNKQIIGIGCLILFRPKMERSFFHDGEKEVT